MFRMYRNPETTKWLGWFENAEGKAIAFVRLDRKVVFVFELG